jgi:hypothetical protein
MGLLTEGTDFGTRFQNNFEFHQKVVLFLGISTQPLLGDLGSRTSRQCPVVQGKTLWQLQVGTFFTSFFLAS